jgi:malonate decarboxylase alpha subunit
MFPSDLGVDVATATRDWLAAKTIADLVTASGGLYAPPAKFRPQGVAQNATPVTRGKQRKLP